MNKYAFDYITKCEVCGIKIRFDNPFRAKYKRVCDNVNCISKYKDK